MLSVILWRLALAGLVLGGGVLLASFVSGWIGDELYRRGVDPALRSHAVAAIEPVLRGAVGLVALAVLGVPVAPMVVVLAAATLVLAYALKDTLRDVAAGAWLLQVRPFRLGDVVLIGEHQGAVARLDLLAVVLDTAHGQVVLPSRLVASHAIVVVK